MSKKEEDQVRLYFEYFYETNSININAQSKKCKSVGYLQKYYCKNLNSISEKELKDIKKIQKELVEKVSDKHKDIMSDFDQEIYDYCFENNSSHISTAEFIIQNKNQLIKLLLHEI